jgi:hypothetical protein
MSAGDSSALVPSRSPIRDAGWGGASGCLVARLFHRLLAAIFLMAWISLATQIRLLVGSRGLLPLADFVDAARAEGALSWFRFPSLLMLAPGDGPLVAGTIVGVALAVVGLAGVRPRICAALQTILYLGYVTACRGFLGFQWDNLLLECGLLATFLPTDRPAPVTHFLFRALLFKLYFESGIAKWQSPLHDWQDGSAMTFYYETAPLPTALAWYAHHLPGWWHRFESRATLFVELIVPFAVFGPRRARLVAAVMLTAFQIVNLATANYGFFCYLTLTLHVFLLDDQDVQRLGQRTRRLLSRATTRLPSGARLIGERVLLPIGAAVSRLRGRQSAKPRDPTRSWQPRFHRVVALAAAAAWIAVSLAEAVFHFGDPGAAAPVLVPVLELSQTFRLVNTYHLFAAVTRERIEPEIQIQTEDPSQGQGQDAGAWRAHLLRYKPGDVTHAPRFVAPHQPRVDFLLWFYGLGYQRRPPVYAINLLARLCEDPAAVASLFPAPLPPAPRAVRIVFWDYRFTSPAEKRATGRWWSRRELDATAPLTCASGP